MCIQGHPGGEGVIVIEAKIDDGVLPARAPAGALAQGNGNKISFSLKRAVVPLLDEVRGRAVESGAANTVVLEDGRQEIMTGLFTYGRVHMTSPIAEQLGCAFDQGPLGPFIRTDEGRQTTVPAVFAAGDAMRAASSVALSVADGAMAGVGAHRSLLFGVTPFAAPMIPAAASSATCRASWSLPHLSTSITSA